jgi:hypothetical protein
MPVSLKSPHSNSYPNCTTTEPVTLKPGAQITEYVVPDPTQQLTLMDETGPESALAVGGPATSEAIRMSPQIRARRVRDAPPSLGRPSLLRGPKKSLSAAPNRRPSRYFVLEPCLRRSANTQLRVRVRRRSCDVATGKPFAMTFSLPGNHVHHCERRPGLMRTTVVVAQAWEK